MQKWLVFLMLARMCGGLNTKKKTNNKPLMGENFVDSTSFFFFFFLTPGRNDLLMLHCSVFDYEPWYANQKYAHPEVSQ